MHIARAGPTAPRSSGSRSRSRDTSGLRCLAPTADPAISPARDARTSERARDPDPRGGLRAAVEMILLVGSHADRGHGEAAAGASRELDGSRSSQTRPARRYVTRMMWRSRTSVTSTAAASRCSSPRTPSGSATDRRYERLESTRSRSTACSYPTRERRDAARCFGSYLVYRKLEQNVQGFERRRTPRRPSARASKATTTSGPARCSSADSRTARPWRIQSADGTRRPIPNNFTYADDERGPSARTSPTSAR